MNGFPKPAHRPSEKLDADRLRLLGFFALISLVTYLDRVNISIAAAPISKEFGFTQVQLGTIFSAFVIGYMLFQIPGGWLGDRYGHGKIIVLALIWWSIFTAATAFGGSRALAAVIGVLPGFWFLRFVIGVGEAATYPCANGLVAQNFSPQQRALAAGVMFGGVGAGSAFAPPFIASLMLHFGWRSAFYLCGAIGIILALAFHVFLSRRQRRESNEVDAVAARCRGKKSSEATPWKRILRHPQVWLLTISDFLHGYIVYIYFYWFYLYLVNVRHFSLLKGSWLATLPFITIMVFAPGGGWLSDRLISSIGPVLARRRVAMGGLFAGAVLIFFGAVAHSAYFAIGCLSLAAGSIYIALSCYWASALEVLPPHAATVSGIMNAGANLGGAISPIVTPWIAVHYGWVPSLCVASAFSLIAGLLWKFIGSTAQDEQTSPNIAS